MPASARRAGTRRATLAVAALTAFAQLATRPAAAAQTVLLEIRPRAGDTLRMRLDQTVEMTGTTRLGEADSTRHTSTTMHVLARAIVLKTDSRGSMILAVTDSVSLSSMGGPAPAELERMSHALEGKRVEMRVSPDGSARMADDGAGGDLRAAVAQMPASLPATPVSVGDRWTRVMRLPVAGPEIPAGGELHATFRFDSLSRDGDIAYLSMKGYLTRDSTEADVAGGMRFLMSGTVVGALQVDRRRGWLTDAQATMIVRSRLTPRASGAAPMRFQMKIIQRVRAMDKR